MSTIIHLVNWSFEKSIQTCYTVDAFSYTYIINSNEYNCQQHDIPIKL